MLGVVAKKFFGSSNERILKKFKKNVDGINNLESKIRNLTDEALKNQTVLLKQKLAAGASLDDILPEAFATVREAAWRVLGQRPFDVQLLGGMALHKGMICEMRTGEGKTLVSTLPSYLNALTEKGVHIITVNDYLAQRDAEWMGRIHRFLGLSVGCIVHDMDDDARRRAYASDITYGTNHEIGFDYLRDNMKFHLEQRVQRSFNFALIDEVDSILIDEARTPLIISGTTEGSINVYQAIDQVVAKLKPEDFDKDEKQRSVSLTEAGAEHIEELLETANLLKEGTLYESHNISLMHYVNQALRAHTLFTKDVDYIVKDNKVIIIDEFTGRMMQGRRYSDSLHQALEAKEGVEIEEETQTLASITYQNLFRLYPTLSGMTGTAMTEAGEFAEIYKLEVLEIPTNKPVMRKDGDDVVYRTAREKYKAILALIQECHARQQPVLVGTVSIEKSEYLSDLLKTHKIPHQVLNARVHEQEAYIIAEAGRPGAVTIATNMAGRGTDIQLGGNFDMRLERVMQEKGLEKASPELIQEIKVPMLADAQRVRESGGLFVIGTERHESRRIDNQLRGRSGRQGDPGASQFFLSLDDDLMRIFGSDRLDGVLKKLGLQEDEAITHPWINRALEKAQKKVEARNFDIRKHLLKYDDVMNDQRKVIYEQRVEIMRADQLKETFLDMAHDVLERIYRLTIPQHTYPEDWNIKALGADLLDIFALSLPLDSWVKEEGITDADVYTRLGEAIDLSFSRKEAEWGEIPFIQMEKTLLLRMLDQAWKDHLLSLDHLREGINLRAYAQRDPLNEYKQEAFSLFQSMLGSLKLSAVTALFNASLSSQKTFREDDDSSFKQIEGNMHESSPKEMADLLTQLGLASEDIDRSLKNLEEMKDNSKKRALGEGERAPQGSSEKLRRNETCPCGSGKKYKLCHGLLT